MKREARNEGLREAIEAVRSESAGHNEGAPGDEALLGAYNSILALIEGEQI